MPPLQKPLADKVALVTGASSGLGRAFAVALAGAGASVLLVARREEKLRECVAEIAAAGGEAAYHVTDVRNVAALYDLVDVVLSRYKRLQILINNAGLGWREPLADLKRSQIAEMLETNLAAPIYLTQAALEALKRNAPSDVVNIASSAGLQGYAEGTAYCASKHGVVGFTRALAEELKPDGVRVTAICAGSTETEFYDRFRPTTEAKKMLRTEDAVRALLYVLTSPPNVLHGEIVLRPRT
ncbi:MAG TPA: SDR family oxidoreductase [Thermoanaerobaculia bacterium]|nr:SDR family oxidoreductase [Thermoanaerobaculia bacterium]